MEYKNISILDKFGLKDIPDLDISVLGALELFQKETLPKLDLDKYKKILVIGSGNAEATGRIIFEKSDAIFASESTFKEKLKNTPDIEYVIIISASGGKHAPIIAEYVKNIGKKIVLITNNPDAQAKEFVENEDIFVFPKNREPYTYNTSTYLGMILGYTLENPRDIEDFIQEKINKIELPDFSKYNKFFFIVPTRFSGIRRIFQIKFMELFGRNIANNIETNEYMKHGVTIVPTDELFISFGEENTIWGNANQRLHIPIPDDADYATIFAIGYYIIGQIQKKHPSYFKDNIVAYTDKISELFGQKISPIVE